MRGDLVKMRIPERTLATALVALMTMAAPGAAPVGAPQAGAERLAEHLLDVAPPSTRVRGTPGAMAVHAQPCRVLPTASTRRRIIDVAVQEWAFFGFRIVDRTEASEFAAAAGNPAGPASAPPGAPDGRRRPRYTAEEGARIAASIGGYWAVTPEGSWIVGRQNAAWRGPDGTAARWNAPWSAAFISWVMCEAGLGSTNQFQRAVAHHAYLDQAIRARDGRAAQAAFAAYETGESAIAPGDMLCSSRRPVYRSLAERRRQMGAGARTHCDIVVRVDEARERILVIGGNVRGIVSLKLLRAERRTAQPLRVVDPDEERPIFAHLKLRADPIEANPLRSSPAMQAFACDGGRTPASLAAAAVAAPDIAVASC